MGDFTVRVELHGAEWEDYDALYEEMRGEGFTRVVLGSSGVSYELPNAEYNFSGEATRTEVLRRAKRAANTTGFSFGILVTESRGRSWVGLDPAE